MEILAVFNFIEIVAKRISPLGTHQAFAESINVSRQCLLGSKSHNLVPSGPITLVSAIEINYNLETTERKPLLKRSCESGLQHVKLIKIRLKLGFPCQVHLQLSEFTPKNLRLIYNNRSLFPW